MEDPSTMTVAAGCVTAILLTALFFIKREASKRNKGGAAAGSSSAAGKGTKKGLDKSKYPGGRITIYYATQTGTAESFAQQLEREGPDYGFFVHIVDMEDVTEVEQFLDHPPFDDDENENEKGNEDTKKCRAIVMAATYGEGEPTDNSASIVQVIKEVVGEQQQEEEKNNGEENNENKPLADKLDFTVFGLGNRQYEHYNSMGKFFDKHLEVMGGTRMYDLGLGDDDADLEADFEAWKDQLWTTLQAKYHVSTETKLASSPSAELNIPTCEYEIEYHDNNNNNNHGASNGNANHDIPLEKVHGSSKHYFTSFDCPVPVTRELRSPEDGGSTVHMEIDISNHNNSAKNGNKVLQYETADNLGVCPINDPAVVESVAKNLGYDLDQVFSLTAGADHEWHGAPFPMPITVRECLTRYLDLTSAPRRSDLKQLIPYAKDALDRKALTRLSSKEGKQEYKEKIVDGYKGIVDLLALCPSLTIPLEHLVSVCKLLLPRYYTISSSSNVHPDRIHLTVAVTEDMRKDGTKFQGVCSTHLASTKTVRVFVRPSTFRLPEDASKPILMIGPGTGIAPMRALLQERRHQKLVQNKKIGKNILYFGCKKRSLDYLYEEELAQFKKEGELDALHVAFSRESKEKVYVQHLLAKHAKDTWNLLDAEGAYIYVCGGVKMGHDVTEALQEILSTQGQMSFPDAKEYLAKMASAGRYVQELWA